MSTFSKDVTKASKKGLGVVIFAVAVNMIGKYTVRKQPFLVYNTTMGAKVLVAATAGILATQYTEVKWMAKS